MDKKLTREQYQEIIDLYYYNNITPKKLSEIYNIAISTIMNVLHRQTYKDLNRPQNYKEILLERRNDYSSRHKWRKDYYNSFPELTEKQKSILIGSLLGDGYLQSLCNDKRLNSSFGKNQCLKSQEYIEWIGEELKPFTSKIYKIYTSTKPININNNVIHEPIPKTHVGWAAKTLSLPVFTELRKKWYPDSKKIVPNDLILNPQILSIFYCDDGHNNFKGRNITLATLCFSFDEVDFLIKRLKDDLDINSKIMRKYPKNDQNKQSYIYISGYEYENFLKIVNPYIIWECFKYKTLISVLSIKLL